MGLLSDVAGAVISGGAALLGGKSSSDANIQFQKKFAKNAIQWKVQDALKAGIHPLYALGAPTMSPSANVGQVGEAISSMGQDIGRAVAAGGTAEDRKLRELQLQRAGLENELIKAQIIKTRAPGTGPGSPVGASHVIDGQGDTSAVIIPGRGAIPLPPNVVPAQVAENIHGEVTDIPYGINFAVQTLFGPGGPFNEKSTLGDLRAVRDWWNRRAAIGRGRMSSWR